MEKNHYYLTSVKERNFIDAGKNKREAIKAGRIMALELRQSVELYHCHEIGLEAGKPEGRLGRYYLGILEFPYFLSSACHLIPSDITVNLY